MRKNALYTALFNREILEDDLVFKFFKVFAKDDTDFLCIKLAKVLFELIRRRTFDITYDYFQGVEKIKKATLNADEEVRQ